MVAAIQILAGVSTTTVSLFRGMPLEELFFWSVLSYTPNFPIDISTLEWYLRHSLQSETLATCADVADATGKLFLF